MKKYFVIILVILAAGFIYIKFIHPPKNDQIKYLMANNYTTGTINQLSGLGNDYIFAWYRAAKKGMLTFKFGNKTYKTQGGTAI